MIPKYRAWDKRKQLMREVAVLDFNKNGNVSGIQYWKTPYDLQSIHANSINVMQSTGLKDKNGVEIFEGDVVSVRNHPFQKTELSGAGIEIDGDYLIGWSDHSLAWLAGDLLLYQLKPYIEVIGNIYENPELLEVP